MSDKFHDMKNLLETLFSLSVDFLQSSAPVMDKDIVYDPAKILEEWRSLVETLKTKPDQHFPAMAMRALEANLGPIDNKSMFQTALNRLTGENSAEAFYAAYATIRNCSNLMTQVKAISPPPILH